MTLTAEKPAGKATNKTTRPAAGSAKARFGNATIVLSERDFDRLFRCSSHRLLMAGRGELRSLFEHGGNLYAILAADEALAESSRAFRVCLGEAVRVVFADDYQGEALPFSVEAMLHEDRLEGMAVQHQGIGYVMTGGGVTFTTELAEAPTPAPKRPNPIHELGTGEANRPVGQGQTWYQWCSSFGLPGGSAAWESERTANGPAWQAYLRGLKASEYRKELERQPRSWHAWCAEFEIPGTPEEWDRVRADGGPAWGMYLRGLRASGHHETAAALEEARKATDAANVQAPVQEVSEGNDSLRQDWYAWCRKSHPSGPTSYFDKIRAENGELWQAFLRDVESKQSIPQGIKGSDAASAPANVQAAVQANVQLQIPPIDTSYCLLPLSQITASTFNPREDFDSAYLDDLAASIKENGVLQPITVRPINAGSFKLQEERTYRGGTMIDGCAVYRGTRFVDWFPSRKEAQENLPRYEIIAGECRWRASKLAEMEMIPALIRPADDDTSRVLAVIENLQRKDLNPFDEARGFRQLMDIGWSQGKIAEKVGCNQSRVSKTLNLTRLPEDVQTLIREGKLTPSHGERLVRFVDFPALCSAIAEKAVANRTTAADLDGKGIPFAYDLGERKVLKQIYYSTTVFDASICRKCPFGAFRAGPYDNMGYCLKPEHYTELEQEVITAQQASLKAAQEAVERETTKTLEKAAVKAAVATAVASRASDGSSPNCAPSTVDTVDTVDVVAAQKAAAIKHLPMLSDLKYNTCEDLSSRRSMPADCTPDCPCRAAALIGNKGDDKQPVDICTNPARFKKLQDAEKRANNKASRIAYARRFETARFSLDTAVRGYFAAVTAPVTQRVIVITVWDSLRSAGVKAVLPAAARLGITIDFEAGWHLTVDGRPALWDQLESLATEDLLRLTAEALMEREIWSKFTYGDPKPTDSLGAVDWITSAAESTVSEEPA